MSVRQAACRAHWFGQFYYCGKKVALLFAAIDLLLRAALEGSFRGEGRIGGVHRNKKGRPMTAIGQSLHIDKPGASAQCPLYPQ